MQIQIKVPTLGESISEAVVSNLIKASGSYIQAEEEIIELETDKLNQVLQASHAGVLSWNVKVGDSVQIGQLLGSIDTAAAPAAAPNKEPAAAPKPVQPPTPPEKKTPTPALPAAPKPIQGPPARRMADDFVSELKSPKIESARPPSPVLRKRMSNLRKTIAQRLVEVKNTTAMLTTFNEIDMSTVMAIRAKEKDLFLEKYGVKLGFMSFFVTAVTAALKAFPEVHSFIEADEIVTPSIYDIGVAVSTDKGLIVPVIRDCETLSFAKIEQQIDTFAKKARSGTLSIDDIRGGSFTITNGGVFGSLLSTPILNPPQSAILGMHAIVKRPVALGDQIVLRPMMYVALSYDHRLIDGKEAVSFLVHLKQTLEDPNRILLDL